MSISERKLEIQVGVVFLLALAILVFGVLWFKNYKYRAEKVEVTVVFPKTSGLIKGDPVEVLGVPSGQVSEIRNEGGRAVVVLDLTHDVKLYKDTRIALENVGIMGQKLVAVYPGGRSEPVPLDGSIFQGEYQSGVAELMSELSGTLQAVDQLAKRMDSVLRTIDEGAGGSAGETLENAKQITADLAVFLRDSRGDLTHSVRSFRQAMDDVHQSLEGREETIGQMVDRTANLTVRMDTAMTSLGTTLAQIQRIMTSLENGEGTIGKMMQDDSLHHELIVTLKEARTLVEDIRTNPKKYVKLSLF